jgi:hypothetical protein
VCFEWIQKQITQLFDNVANFTAKVRKETQQKKILFGKVCTSLSGLLNPELSGFAVGLVSACNSIPPLFASFLYTPVL